MNLNKKALELAEKRIPYAFVTIVAVRGSAPRHTGSKMIVTTTESFDTIGGGALELRATEDARDQIKKGTATTLNYPLGPLLGQCCGGEVDIFIDPVMPKKEMIVFGAGHVAEALVPLLEKLNFDVTLIDEREERIFLPIFDNVKRMNELPSDALKTIRFNDQLYIIVITHEHKDDEEIVTFCLDKPFKYLGLIGSRKKWGSFVARFKAKGFTDDQIGRIKTPIGIDIGSETPFEIAVSISAELIKLGSSKC